MFMNQLLSKINERIIAQHCVKCGMSLMPTQLSTAKI